MKICVIVGSEGVLGTQIAQAKLSNPENIVIGFDQLDASSVSHERFQYVSGRVESRTDLSELRKIIFEIQNTNNIENEIDCIINSFAAREFKFNEELIPETIAEQDWMLWGWLNYPDRDFLGQYDVNVVGIHRVLTELYEIYKDSRSCSVINFSSQYAKRNLDQQLFKDLGHFIFKPPAYSATKAAIQIYTEYLSQVFKNTGIRVNSIAPGVVDTGQVIEFKEKYSRTTNTGRLMKPSEIAGAIEFLTSDDSSYMNGTCLILDGGWSSR